jgi:hypothetical protein
MNKDYPVYTFEELADKLIKDIEPYENIDYPSYGTIGDKDATYSFIPISYLLGDLYLWKKQYPEAAQKYYNLIYKKRYVVNSQYSSYWTDSRFLIKYNGWSAMFGNFTDEMISVFNYTLLNARSYMLYFTYPSNWSVATSAQYQVMPSDVSRDMWKGEMYTYYNSQTQQVYYEFGDLRGFGGSYAYAISNGDSIPCITKYMEGTGSTDYAYIYRYRVAGLYLRYAEAVNQAGKPSLAFAILKYGLNEKNLSDPKIVSPQEITPLPSYCNFNDSRFAYNVGIRSRGLGAVNRDSLVFVFPDRLKSQADSIDFVDDLICNEAALETAFEGNRFHDLMRFALRRNDVTYLADKVGRKYKNQTVRNKLMNPDNWYLPTK